MGILARRKPEQATPQQQTQSLPPPQDDENTKQALESLVKLAERIPAEGLLKDGAEVAGALQAIKQQTGISIKSLRNSLNQLLGRSAKQAQAKPPEPSADVKARADEILNQLKCCTDLAPVFQKHFGIIGYIANKHLTGGVFKSHGARLLNKASCFGTTGIEGSGKSDAFIIGAECLPPEIVLSADIMSAKAPCYMEDISHMYMLLGEMNPVAKDADDQKQTILRQAISGIGVTNVIVDKNEHGRNEMRTMHTKMEGTVVVFTSITEQHNWDGQYRSRTSWLSSDESEATTGDVMKAVAKTKGSKPPSKKEQESVRLAWQQFNRTLEPQEVYIPFVDDDDFIPTTRHVYMRRTFWLLINYIEISALQHQHVRDRHTDGRLIATPDDYSDAYNLLTATAPRRNKLVGEKAAKVFTEILKPALPSKGSELGAPQIIKLLKVGKSTGYYWIDDYVTAGWLEPTAETKNSRSKKYTLGDDTSQPADDLGLLAPDEVEKTFLSIYPNWKTGKLPQSATGAVIPLPTAKLESDWKAENSPIPTVFQNDDWKPKDKPGKVLGDLSGFPTAHKGNFFANDDTDTYGGDFQDAVEI